MTGRTALSAVVAVVATVLVVIAGCTVSRPDAAPRRTPTPSPASSPTPTRPASPPPAPRVGSCHRLTLAAAGKPTDSRAPVPCSSEHTTVTVRVGRFDPVQDGHLLTADSAAVQRQIADHCPASLTDVVGGTREQRRLSRFTVVWFSPTVAQGQAGATWFRCDIVALASRNQLAQLPAHLNGVLDRPHALDRFGICGTAAPGSPRFHHVTCAEPHSWRAVGVVDLPRGSRLHSRAAGNTANAHCKQVAANSAHGSLKYTWAFEWPTPEQWQSGRRYGFCWLPDH